MKSHNHIESKSNNLLLAIKSTKSRLVETNNNYYQSEFGFLNDKVKELESLITALEKKLNGNYVNFNDIVRINYKEAISHHNKTKTTSFLKIAANYLDANVLDVLLANGAQDPQIIHSAIKYNNEDLDNIIKVLKKYNLSVDAVKNGHTALFKAHRHKKEMVIKVLNNHHAHMLFSERISNPILNIKENIEETINQKLNSVIPPHC